MYFSRVWRFFSQLIYKIELKAQRLQHKEQRKQKAGDGDHQADKHPIDHGLTLSTKQRKSITCVLPEQEFSRNCRQRFAKSCTTAFIKFGISDGDASTAGSQPDSRSVLLVTGPMDTAATPASGKLNPAARTAFAR